jgi:APA family basic amino acid/polyamine antiporter
VARRIPVLGRVLGTPALYAMAYGEIGSSLYYALGITAVYALSTTPAVFIAAGFLFALAAASYAEAGATIPDRGGASAYARRAFNDMAGFVAGWATVLDYVISISLAALFIPHYMAAALGKPGYFSSRQALGIAIAIVAGITAFRLVRRTNAYAAGVALSLLDLVVQAALALFGLVLLFDWHALRSDIDLGTKPTWSALAFALPLAMVAFTGLEKVSGLAGMAKHPERTVPDAIRTSVFTVVIVYTAMATAATSAYPFHADPSAPAGYSSELTSTWLNAPLVGLASAVGGEIAEPVKVALRMIVGLTATGILLLAITTSFSGCARLADAMAERSQLPALFGVRGRRALLPTWAFVGVGSLATGFLLVGAAFEQEEVLTLASLYSFGILIALGLTQASIFWLRIAEPDMPRPFTMRGNLPIAGRSIPLPAVLGAFGAFAVGVVALGTHPGARVVGPLWMMAGLLMYTAVRVQRKLPLMARYEVVEAPEEVVQLRHSTIVVPLERVDLANEEIAAIACRIALEQGGRIVGVTAIPIPMRDPLSEPAPEAEGDAAAAQAMALRLALDYGIKYVPVVQRTRNPGRTIVDVAGEYDADLIVVGSPAKERVARTREEAFFGRTVDFILRKAPCRVIVTHLPAESATEAGTNVASPA